MQQLHVWLLSLTMFALPTTFGCGRPQKSDPLQPSLDAQKTDGNASLQLRGPLGVGDPGAVAGVFSQDGTFFGHPLTVTANAKLTIEVTQQGSSTTLDSTLFVVGPKTATGSYGSHFVATDDDSGWGSLSRIRGLILPAAGEYLVIVGTYDGHGRGSYRLQATCESASCTSLPSPARTCHPAIAQAITACVADHVAAPDYDSYAVSRLDLIESCADAEPVAPAWQALCKAAAAPSDLCNPSYERFCEVHLPVCRRQLINRELDHTCVFGDRYMLLFEPTGAVVVISQKKLTHPSSLTPIEAQQIVKAVHATAHTDVTTVDQAFDAVDDHVVNQLELYDASNRRGYTAYEVGAGDNSFGMYFNQGTTITAARNNDGDLMDCKPTWGKEMRSCGSDGDCATGLRCTGYVDQLRRGRCIDLKADTHAAIGASCVGPDGCPAGSGLVCTGALPTGSGICRPAWMRGRFVSRPALPVPDENAAGTSAQLSVYGLATVDTDVVLDVDISHSRTKDLRVTLVNAGGTEVVVFDGKTEPGPVSFFGRVVKGFPGDESVNGVWRLHVVDRAAGEKGVVNLFALTITSRWD